MKTKSSILFISKSGRKCYWNYYFLFFFQGETGREEAMHLPLLAFKDLFRYNECESKISATSSTSLGANPHGERKPCSCCC